MRRRLTILGLIVACLFLLAAALSPPGATGATATSWNTGGGEQGRLEGRAELWQDYRMRQAATVRDRFMPLGAALSGTAQLSGRVYSGWGSPLAGVRVGWWVDSSEGTASGQTMTGDDAAYTLMNVAPASGGGGVWTAATDWSWEVDFTGRSWPDARASTYDFTPGTAHMYSYAGGPWFDFYQKPWVTMGGTDLAGGLWSYDYGCITADDEPPAIQYVDTMALPGSYTEVCLNWWSNEGMEKSADIAVAPGAMTVADTTFSQADAQRLWEIYNYTASGDPGTVVKLRLQNFPGGEVTDFYGYQSEPELTPYQSFGSYTARDLANQYKSVTIPLNALPGQDYVIGGQHHGGLLDLRVYFQVTRLKGPSSARGSYRLTGRVPIQGYDGSATDTGARKYVYLYRRYTAAGQPKGDPTKYGWKLVRRYLTDNTGKFATSSMSPGRTAWYVVYYAGDKDNWPGFTSVRRVRHY